MDRDFTLGTELTEEDIEGDRQSSAPGHSASGSSGLSLNAATNGGWGLVVGALALWTLWWLFPGKQGQAQNAPLPALTDALTAPLPGTPKPGAITVELGANGIVITPRPTASSTPASGVGRPVHKAAQAASQPTRSRAASAAVEAQPDQ